MRQYEIISDSVIWWVFGSDMIGGREILYISPKIVSFTPYEWNSACIPDNLTIYMNNWARYSNTFGGIVVLLHDFWFCSCFGFPCCKFSFAVMIVRPINKVVMLVFTFQILTSHFPVLLKTFCILPVACFFKRSIIVILLLLWFQDFLWVHL